MPISDSNWPALDNHDAISPDLDPIGEPDPDFLTDDYLQRQVDDAPRRGPVICGYHQVWYRQGESCPVCRRAPCLVPAA